MASKSSCVFDLTLPMDHERLLEALEILSERYSFLRIHELCESILGKSIPVLTVGDGKRSVLYVGAHHGMEWMTSMLLLQFIHELCDGAYHEKRMWERSVPILLEQFSVHVIPMLNPDGVDYQIHGITEENPLYQRVISMNSGSPDFSKWQANARGVDLNHNYDAGFREYKRLEAEEQIPCGAPTRYSGQEPESEPEVHGLCEYIRFQKDLRLVLSLHTQGEVIFCGGHAINGTEAAISKLAQLTGYRVAMPEGLAAYGGLTDWCVEKQGIPALTLECGKGSNPLPLPAFFPIYTGLREALFVAPTLF